MGKGIWKCGARLPRRANSAMSPFPVMLSDSEASVLPILFLSSGDGETDSSPPAQNDEKNTSE